MVSQHASATATRDVDSSVETTAAIRHRLLHDVGGLVDFVRRSYRLRALLLWTAGVMTVTLVLISFDLTLRRDEIGLRILFFLLWIVAAIVTAVRNLIPAWKFAPTRIEIAQWVERAKPELGEQLSTAVQLAETPPHDTRFGSIQFRDIALKNWSQLAGSISWKSYLDHTSWLRAGLILLGTMLVVAVLAIWKPHGLGLAVARLFQPWASLPWPQADQLEFVSLPKAIVTGHELQLEIIDRVPPLPQRIDVYVRDINDDTHSEAIAYSANVLQDVAVVTLPSIERAIEVRALGGDDRNMPWQRIDVAQSPKLENFRFHVDPPAYSGQPPTEIVGTRIQVLARSRIRFSGQFEEPIQSLEIVTQSDNNLAQSKSTDDAAASATTATVVPPSDVSVSLEDDKRSFSFAVGDANEEKRTISWRLRVTTLAGVAITSPEVWAAEIVEDAPPIVVLAEQELTKISAEALLPLRGNAADDLGLVQLAMRWQIEASDTTEPGKWQIWSHPADERMPRREFVVDQAWPLESQLPLVAGQRVQIWLEATDTLGQLGKSSLQTLEVSDAQHVLESIASRQSQLLEQVRAITEAQRRNSQLAARNREIIQQSESIRREEVDALANVAQMQQSINRQLNAERNSVADSLRTLQELLANNQLANTDTATQLTDLSKRVAQLGAGSLTEAARDAQTAHEQAKRFATDQVKMDRSLHADLDSSDASQAAALAELQELENRLAQTEALRIVERELAQVLVQQQSLRRDTDNLEIRRLAGLSKEEFQANRVGLQADQQGLAQTLEQLEKRAKTLAEAMPTEQAALSSQIDRAIAGLADSQVSGRMRDATESIAGDRFAQAAETQQGIVESLRQALRQLNASSQRSLEGQLGQMRTTADELSSLAASQASLASKMEAAEASKDATVLAGEQSQLRKTTADLQAQAEQIGNQRTQQQLASAADKQSRAASEALQHMPTAASSAREAAEELAQAAQEFKLRADQVEREATEQQGLQLATALSQLVKQQQPVVATLNDSAQVQLSTLSSESRLSKEQEFRQLASRQEAVRQMVRDVRERTNRLAAFDWTLEQTDIDMARAIAATQRFLISPEATTSAARALRKLEQMAQSMMKSETAPEQEKTTTTSDEKFEEQKTENRLAPPLASLKLLRAVQTDINHETQQINDDSTTMDLGQRNVRVEELAQQQQALGRQIEMLLRELEAATDSNQ